MKKIRILAAVLAVLMLPLALLFGCGKTDATNPCADGHNYPNKWERIQKRSCTKDEIEQRACKNCGWIEQQVKNAATGHVFDEANKVSANDATCTTDGHYVIECTWCDEVKILDYPGSALGHKYVHYVSKEDGYSELAYCVNCNAGTDEKLLGIKLDFEGEKTHLSYTAMSVFTGGNDELATYVTSNGSTALSVKRPAGGVVGSSAYGLVLSPRTDILDNVQYVIEANLVLSGAGNVTITGNKAYGGQSMDFVTYDAAKKEIQVVGGPAYAVSASDLTAGIKIAIVTNDAKSMYDLYVNDVLVAASVEYIDDFYNGFGIGTFEIKMAEGDTASEIIIDNVLLYNATKPNGWTGATNEVYDYYTTKTGENIVTLKLDATCDHDFDYKNVVVNCSASSYTLKECSKCGGAAVTKEIAPASHKWTFSHATNATCWAPAYECNICSVCGLKDGAITAAKLNHELGADKTIVEPTCTSIGYSEGNCRNCGYFFYDKSSEVPALGHEVGADATVIVPDCVTKGYTEGPCIRCQRTYRPAELEKPALGHTCFAPVIFPASCSEAGYTQNVCDACGEEYKTNEVSTTGHVNFSRVVGETIETVCVECGHSTVLNLVKTQPTMQEQLDYINKNGYLFTEHSLDSGWSSNGNLNGTSGGVTVSRGNGKLQNVTRFSYWTITDDPIRPGNKYWDIEYAPQNWNTSSKPLTSAGKPDIHSYMNGYNNTYSQKKGERFVFEFAIKPNKFQFAAMQVQGLERFTKSPYTVNALEIKEDGTVTSKGTVVGKIDPTNQNVWTRIAVVADCTAHTYDVYFNGVLVSSAPIDNNPKSFPYVQEWRVNVGTQDVNRTESQGYCLDEIYCYIAKDPLYITGLNRYDVAALEFGKAENGADGYLLNIGNSKLGYTGKETWKVESVTDTFYGASEPATKNVVKFVKGATGVPSLENGRADSAIAASDTRAQVAWTNMNVKFAKVDGVKVDIMTAEREYTDKTVILETDNPETEEVEPDVYGTKTEKSVYLTLDNGKLVTPDGRVITTVEAGKWYNISFITRETGGKITYEVYVNGMLYRADIEMANSAVNSTTDLLNAYTTFLAAQTDCEYYLADLAVYGNVTVPDTYIGKLEAEVEVEREDITILGFDANTNVNAFVDWDDNSKGNKLNSIIASVDTNEAGEEIDTSYLEIKDATNEGIYAGYQLTQVGLDRVIGADAKDPKWTVKVTNFATNGANYIFPMTSFDGIKVNEDGTYDFSGYKKVIVRMFVEETSGGNISIRFRSADVDGKQCYSYANFAVKQLGWVTFEADIATLAAYNACDITKVVEVYIDTDAKDGTTFYLESVKIGQMPQVITDSGYVKPETPCEEHTFVKGTPVTANCENKGYTIATCSVCGVKEVVDYTEALGHKYVAGATVDTFVGTCETNGVKTTTNTCSVCNDVTYTNAVTKAAGHNWTKVSDGKAKTCTEDGYDIVTCGNANCDHKDLECRYVLVATGHVAVPTSIKVVAPTCEADGYTTAKCSVCNEDYQYDIVPATGHRISETGRDLADCVTDGMIYNSCSNPGCTESANKVIPAKGHTYEESARVPAMNGVDGKITMTCINDGCTDSYEVKITAFPTAAQMKDKLGANIIASMNGENKTFNVGSFAGTGSGEGITANFAKWTVKSDAANGSYINVVVAPEAGEVASNVVLNATGAKVIEFNVKPNGEAFADLTLSAEVNGTAKTLVAIANTGWISVNGVKTYQINVAEDAWTRIAVVACSDNTIDVYVNGDYARTLWVDATPVFGNATIAIGEGADSDAGLCIDEIYAHAGDLSFATGNKLDLDDHDIDFDNAAYFNAAGQLNNSGSFKGGLFTKSKVVYKEDYELKRETLKDTFYGDEKESEKTVLHLKKNASVKEYSTYEKGKYDSYMDMGDFMTNYKATTVHFSMTLKMNVMQDITLINGRRSGSATGWANAYLQLGKNGDIKWLGTSVAKFKQGEWFKIDVYMFATGTYECAIFVNDQFVAFNDGSHSKITQQYKDNTKDSVYRTLSVSGNTNEHDLVISDWDINVDVKFPEIPA